MSQACNTRGRPPAAPLARARWLLMGLFALNGVTLASWLARLPAVGEALGLSPSELGAVLLAGAVGALGTTMVAGAIVTRFGGRCAMTLAAVGFTAAFLLLGLGPALGSAALLTVGVFLNGASFGLSGVPMNVESAAIERRMGRSILPQFHAAFSIGAVAGSLIGAVTALLGVSLLSQFVVTAALAAVWRFASIPYIVLGSATGAGGGPGADGGGPVVVVAGGRGGLRTALQGWREPRTLLIGVVIMAAALSEGAANNWLALAVVDGFDATEAVGAVVFGLFVAGMTLNRLLGTRLIDRFGRVAVLRTSGLVSLAGLLVFGFAPTLPLAGIGVVAWGLGAALAVPIGIAAVSDDPLRAAGRVSVVTAFASMASLGAPPLLGLAAEVLGARHALVLITLAIVVSVSLSRRVAPTPTPNPPRPVPPWTHVSDSMRAIHSGGSDTWGSPVVEDQSMAGAR